MGTIDFQQPIVATSKTNMKLFLIAAVLIASVCAEPESEAKADAKPWLAYSNYGYAGYPYAAGYAAYPHAGVYGAGYNGYAAPAYTTYGAAHLIGKRSADSEPESWYGAYGYASPYTYGGYGSYGYSAYRPYTYGRVYGAYNGYY